MYLYYLITQNCVTSYLQTIAENSVSAYPSIKPDDLGNLNFYFPDIEEQRKISSVLRNIENKISICKESYKTLESLAKLIYDYWFTQFDFPDENGRPYKSSGGVMVWNEKLIAMYVDDFKYHEISIENNAGGTDAFHKPQFFILNVAVGGNWPGFEIDDTQFPNEMLVDYIRVTR